MSSRTYSICHQDELRGSLAHSRKIVRRMYSLVTEGEKSQHQRQEATEKKEKGYRRKIDSQKILSYTAEIHPMSATFGLFVLVPSVVAGHESEGESDI